MIDKMSAIEAKMATLRASYAVRLVEDLDALKAVSRDVMDGTSEEKTRPALAELRKLSHKLSGSGSTFGFPEVSTSAYEIEKLCESLSETGLPLMAEQKDRMADLIDQLVREVETVRPIAS